MTFRRALYALVILLVMGWGWSKWNRAGDRPFAPGPDPAAILLTSMGTSDSATGNIIGIQPYLRNTDYANEASFYQVLQAYVEKAKTAGMLSSKTILVFPEYIGSWLVAANEKRSIYDSGATIGDAMQLEVLSNLPAFLPAYLNSHGKDRAKEALFRMKQAAITKIYQTVFSRLAREYKVSIVAGSAVLADPQVNEQGILTSGNGPLYNTSVVFDTSGTILLPLVKKLFPITDEQGFTANGDSSVSPVFHLPAGNLAVLVCADSWFPAAYRSIAGKADIIAIPSLGGPDSIWQNPWMGYNGFFPPSDVDTVKDYHHIPEGDAWVKYAMAKRAPAAGIHTGMNVFFTGKIWDMQPEGRVLVLSGDSLQVSDPALHRGRITNLWYSR